MAEKLDALDHKDEILWFTALHALRGDLDEAFVWLEKAAKELPRHYFAHDAYLKVMMKDPRWQPAIEQFEPMYEAYEQ